ncbi:polysaccharide export protein [Microbacteriaceae bacterium K1510]|nr:polysaccharide export protein [Microbacteriaceae bacterium K1510]
MALLSVLCASIVAGCSGLPAAGPTAMEITAKEGTASGAGPFDGYIVVDIDPRVAVILAGLPHPTFYGTFQDRRPRPDLRIGVGDGLTVTIWEAAAGGLFSSTVVDRVSPGSRTATIPEQIVAQDGTIQVPYAGRIVAAGRRPADVERAIVNALEGKAVQPQAVVAITQNLSNTVAVAGEVSNGTRVPLTVRGDRILSIIAAAGGIRVPAHETFVRLTRGNRTVSVAFNKILADPRENVFVRPSDVVTVIREPQTFTAFGGTLQNASVPFDATGITLEQAIAKTGGLLDNRADASGVFLLRFEPAPVAAQLQAPNKTTFATEMVPIVYRLNLRDANSYFLASTIPVRNKDILYVANAPLSEVDKVLNMIGHVVAPASSGAAIVAATR